MCDGGSEAADDRKLLGRGRTVVARPRRRMVELQNTRVMTPVLDIGADPLHQH
jgi:hypothetical protein